MLFTARKQTKKPDKEIENNTEKSFSHIGCTINVKSYRFMTI